MPEQVTILAGEEKDVRIEYRRAIKVVYCGMPSEGVFSIAHTETFGQQAFGYNVYYSARSKTIRVGDFEFEVMQVDPEKITLLYLRMWRKASWA